MVKTYYINQMEYYVAKKKVIRLMQNIRQYMRNNAKT